MTTRMTQALRGLISTCTTGELRADAGANRVRVGIEELLGSIPQD